MWLSLQILFVYFWPCHPYFILQFYSIVFILVFIHYSSTSLTSVWSLLPQAAWWLQWEYPVSPRPGSQGIPPCLPITIWRKFCGLPYRDIVSTCLILITPHYQSGHELFHGAVVNHELLVTSPNSLHTSPGHLTHSSSENCRWVDKCKTLGLICGIPNIFVWRPLPTSECHVGTQSLYFLWLLGWAKLEKNDKGIILWHK